MNRWFKQRLKKLCLGFRVLHSMAGVSGGPLVVAGHESSAAVSTFEFWSSSASLIKHLDFELCDVDSGNTDIRVDDLKVVDDHELVEKALQDSDLTFLLRLEGPETVDTGKQLVVAGLSPVKKKRKRGRPGDHDSRAEALQLDGRKAALLAELVKERDAEKQVALSTLHSIRVKEESQLLEISARRLRSAGKLKFTTSTLNSQRSFPSNAMDVLEPLEEVVLSIDFHNCESMKVQEFLVLARQPLTALRDQLYCVTDELASKAGMKVPSGYFFIENVFYNDMRDPEAVDYSENVSRWMTGEAVRRKKCKLSELKAVTMESSCFHDVKFRIGAEYMYCHQGDCKHALVIRDVRLLHRDDERDPAAYPLLRFLPRLKHRKCSICNIYRARKITSRDKLAPESPCYFCDACFDLLHCSQNGDLLYNDFVLEDYYC